MLGALLDAIRTQAPLVSDGGMGTELQKVGLEPGSCGERWNIELPERVLAIHRSYVNAGAQLLTTNTFGANRFILANYGLESHLAEFCRAGARLARHAAGDRCWVLGSVGPCGGFLEPLGEIRGPGLEASLREQMGAMLEEGVDAIILETLSALDELEMGVRIARECGAPCVIASLAYDRTRVGYRTMMGATPEQAAQVAGDAGAHVLGANCGRGLTPADFAEIARAIRGVSQLPLCLQPNAGAPRLEGTAIVYPVEAEAFGADVKNLVRCAEIVGGCCGVSPNHTRALRAAIDKCGGL